MANPYSINFRGLSAGLHSFRFDMGDDFFVSKGYAGVHGGMVTADVELNKKENLLELNIGLSGYLTVDCDICLESIHYPIDGQSNLLVKFSSMANSEPDDDIIVLGYHDYQLDLEEHLYDFIMIQLPMRRTCADVPEKGGCDQRDLEVLEKFVTGEGDEGDDLS